MSRLRLPALAAALAVVAVLAHLGLQSHDRQSTADRNREQAESAVRASAQVYAAKLPAAFGTGPKSEADLTALADGTTVRFVGGESRPGEVVVTFKSTLAYAAPPSPFPTSASVCFRDVLTGSGGAVRSELSTIPCAELITVRPGGQLSLSP